MTLENGRAFQLTRTFVHLADGGGAAPVECTADFWKETASGKRRYDRLVGLVHAKRAEDLHPSMWEMHPGGDELLYLVSGAIDVILEEPVGERVELRAGKAYVVPRGVWHRLVLREPGQLLFINSRTGMQHRPV
jgi:mannose-6-phosphate isomerase-like protein (cupin superfamily)